MRLNGILLLAVCACSCAALDAPPATAPKSNPLTHEERPVDWLMAVERLRQFPRPGDLQNAGVLANIGDIVATTPAQQAEIAAAVKAYDAALLEKAKTWEHDLAEMRAAAEIKIVASLPEVRRDAAKKALDYSHAQWSTPYDFEVRLKSAFLQKKSILESKTLPDAEADAARHEFVTYIKTQRLKAAEHDAETIKTLKTMLEPQEAERLNQLDKNRVVPVPERPRKP